MRKIMTVFLAAVIFLDIVCFGVLLLTKDGGDEKPERADSLQSSELIKRASIVAFGDNIIHQEIIDQAYARAVGDNYDFSIDYEAVADIVSKADLAMFSQTTCVSPSHNISGKTLYNAPEQITSEMKKIGFDIVNIATGHSLDYGEEGLINTISSWKNAGVTPIGAYENAEASNTVTMGEVNGITFAFIGFTDTTNGYSLPGDATAVLITSEYESWMQTMILQAKQQADFVIVYANWGIEYETEVTESQRALAEKLSSWGADLIVGTHPHVIQPVEYITRADGTKTLVAYSLGNFLSAQPKKETLLGGMLRLDISKNVSSGIVTIETASVEGVVTHYGYDMANVRVYPLSAYTADLAGSHGINQTDSGFSLPALKKQFSESVDKEFIR